MLFPKMILFDYGGTLLLEPDPDMLRAEKAVFKHVIRNPHGFSPEELAGWETAYFHSLHAVRSLNAESTEIQLLRLKYELHGIELDISYEEAEKVLWDNLVPMTERCLCPRIRELLACLHAQGVRTGVISNIIWSGAALRRRINTLLPQNRFEFILASSDYGLRKPDGRLFRIALEKAGLPAGEIWYCGDRFDPDIVGSHQAGLFPVFYLGGSADAKQKLESAPPVDFPYKVVHDWQEWIDPQD